MAIRDIKYLDEFAPWISKLEFRAGQWNAQFHPGKTVIAFSLVTVTEKLLHHVMYETIELACEALNITPKELMEKKRERTLADTRQVIANILLSQFDHKISYKTMADAIGWTNHSMMIHSRNQSDVKEIKKLIEKVYSRYPFLKDNTKPMF
jgi:chromosomal replication initiation ATPase DnaA